ncbi:DNA polymerase III subunit delta [Candidatus Pelagibacter bacterium nBUS_33]|uniref:DNA polymerase III subunit delta n=1 Tax=Candidatus Pelagibacter bacterium nBUS_33 TaxID=3374193 RepID=UPI003EB71F52
MIIKSYEVNKINPEIHNLLLFYGKNEGLKNHITKNIIKNTKNIHNYDEKEVLDNEHIFIDNLLTKSLFDEKKLIIIKRSTDKILKIIEGLKSEKLEDITIIINADNLEKKSKLRSFFEKNKETICIAFYPDNDQTLSKLAYDFLKNKKISISQSSINLIINKCNGDREALYNELNKIDLYTQNGKKVTTEDIMKITNLIENHSVSELVDNCLAKNNKKIINILNENNFNNEDCILIVRSLLNKSKRILQLVKEFQNNKNIELTISSAKPPIFWKDKEITKQQIKYWRPESIKDLIYKLIDIEFLIKKNVNNSINLITDFILGQSSSKSNN